MIAALLLLIPFLAGLLLVIVRPAQARPIALVTSLASLAVVLFAWISYTGGTVIHYEHDWVNAWGLRLVVGYDGVGLLMVILTGVVFPFIIGAGYGQVSDRPALFNGLLLFTQSFLFLVFLAQNALLFYIGYELTLIPVFLLLLSWGGAGRRAITVRFFIYTLVGGLSLLFGIIYLLVQSGGNGDLSALANLTLPASTQLWLFWALFLAFAIKLPIFPFHSWQPETYYMAPLQGTMVLGAVMLKMGLYGVYKLVFPMVPAGVEYWQTTVIALALIGAVYGGIIAFRQTDFKRLVAFSSLSHVGVLCAGLFAWNAYGISGSFYQAFAHAILVLGMLYLVGAMQERTGTTDMGAMGGLKGHAPRLAALFLLVLVNAVALPLTQSFVGEWLMFAGLWQVSGWLTLFALTTIVIGAIYMLYAYQRVMLGPDRANLSMADASTRDHLYLVPLIAVTLILGVYPGPILELVDAPVQQLLTSLSVH
ncbi:MAG TPA: NADH-quinone oxidoreductase subunit M [Flavobacteriales bacterium]|nr:NADH-quinone oxidoreductase subunit M [Flavobacteriales bacterium]